MLFSCRLAFSQSADVFDEPLVNGERALRFHVNTANVAPDQLDVTVFYSPVRGRLDNLANGALPRGTPILKEHPTLSGVLAAEFVFPHPDCATDPNRWLYIKEKVAGGAIVTYDSVESQVTSSAGFLGWPIYFTTWPVNRPAANSPLDINPVVHERDTCIFYRVRVKRNGTVTFTSPVRSFRMPDTYNIAIAGDSYGAGEGAPRDNFELGGNNADMWSHNDCHRSRRSGLLKAVKNFIHDHPSVAVDYVHTACSGAWIRNLTTDEQEAGAIDFSEPHPVQFDIVQNELLGSENQFHKELNLLLLSTGGNNAGFARYVIDYIILPGNSADNSEEQGTIDNDLAALAPELEALNENIQSRFPTAKVALSTYPDPTNGPRGLCGTAPGPVEFGITYSCCLGEVNQVFNPIDEYRFTSEHFVAPLNSVITNAVTAANVAGGFPHWYAIDVAGLMGPHGLCDCDEPYINRLTMSIATQGDPFGIAHPTDTGYRKVYAKIGAIRISDAFNDFVIERKGGILLAIAFGIESPAIPRSCTRLLTADFFWQLLDVEYPPKLELLREFVLNKDVIEARIKEDVPKLKQTIAFKELLSNVQARKIYDQAFPRPVTRPKPIRQKPSVRDREAAHRLRKYIRSREYQEIRAKVLADTRKFAEPKDDDTLDRFFNRKERKRNLPKR